MVTKNVMPVDVIQVMLIRRILPCQCRSRPLWEFNSKKHQSLKRLCDTSHEGAFMESVKGWQSGWFYITEPRKPYVGGGPRVQIWYPHAAPLLEREGLAVG